VVGKLDEYVAALRSVKEAFVVANKVKSGPFTSEDVLLTSIDKLKREVHSLPDDEIESLVTDHVRRDYFNRAKWRLDRVDLNECEVWPRMGDRDWAEGSVAEVAELFRSNEPKESRIWEMQKFAKIFASELPIIVFVCPGKLSINDGCHRAVVMMLAGCTSTLAWVGTI
jgi:hypothetical protein